MRGGGGGGGGAAEAMVLIPGLGGGLKSIPLSDGRFL